jgi:PAS domain S-box-containing protein
MTVSLSFAGVLVLTLAMALWLWKMLWEASIDRAILRHRKDADASLHAAAECSLDAIFLCEAVRDRSGAIKDFVFTYLNSNAVAMAELPGIKLAGGSLCTLLPIVRPLGLFDRYKQVVETGEPLIHEFCLDTAGGQIAWRRVQAVKLRDGFAATASDITARKIIELRLEETSERLTLATRAGALGVWDWDLVHNNNTWDDTMFRLYGMARDEPSWTFDQWPSCLHPDDLAHVEHELELALAGSKEFDHEFRVIWPDKSVHTLQALAVVQRNQAGEPVRVIGINRDVTSEKQAVADLVESNRSLEEARLRLAEEAARISSDADLILNSAGEGIYGLNQNGITTFVNPAAAAMTGWKVEEILGKLQHDLTHHSYADGTRYPRELCPIYMALHDGKVHRSDSEVFWRKDGSSFPVAYTSTPVFRDGRLDGAVVLFQEISDRKRRESAEAANEAKSNFLSHMSHEIRTPMNGVLGMLQLLSTTDLSAEQRRYLDVARSSGKSMMRMLGDILDLSKLEARMVGLANLEFDLRRTVEEILEVWRIGAREKGLGFELLVEPDTPVVVRGDPDRLRQVLDNLSANAIKFTDQGQIRWSVCLEGEESGVALVRFTVSDSGIGIQADKTATLFQPFVQADAATTRRYGGTGLGLNICKHLVELMGGTIRVDSRAGKGSIFTFTVEFGAASARDFNSERTSPSPANSQASVAADSPPSGFSGSTLPQHARILIAEDNPTNREVACAQLMKLGYKADIVANGAEAVAACARRTYDLVLMDCEMPLMDGYEATRQIRALPIPRIAIIAVTANMGTNDRDRCLASGMDDSMTKPVDLVRLSELLAHWCSTPKSSPLSASIGHSNAETPVRIFDEESLLQRLLGDRTLAQIILQGFLQNLPQQLERLRHRALHRDAQGGLQDAHTLKGSSATVSATLLSATARAMEHAALEGDMERFGSLLPRAHAESKQLIAELERMNWIQPPAAVAERSKETSTP